MRQLPAAARRLPRALTGALRQRSAADRIRRIEVDQRGTRLLVDLHPAAGLRPEAVWARSPLGSVQLGAFEADGDRYRCDVDLRPLAAEGPDAGVRLFVLEADFVRTDDPTTRSRSMLGGARRTQLGRFQPVTVDGHLISVRPTVALGIEVGVGPEAVRPASGAVHVSLLRITGGTLHVRGRISTRYGHHLTGATLALRGRTSHRELRYDIPFEPDVRRTAASAGLGIHRFHVRADLQELLVDPEAGDDFFDAYALITTEEQAEPQALRIGDTPFHARYLTNSGWAERDGRAVVVNPYYTFKAKRTSFQVSVRNAGEYRYLRAATRARHLLRLRHRGRDVWLIGERPAKAQDNGFHFFRYLRTEHPELEAYYVIQRDSPERGNVAPLGNVVDFGSKEHVRASLLARKVAGTHHPDFLYPLRTRDFRRRVRATRVFLQHGVMGTKWMANLYGKGAGTFETDLFLVSSEREREYVVSDFGFEPGEVAVTGLARFDALFAGDVRTVAGQVLVMPTWRDWLQNVATFTESEYFVLWSSLLHDPRLRELEQQYGLQVILCLHPNMQQYLHLFDDLPVKVVSQGEIDVQQLLKESAVLVTDYSSVGFDFSFLNKPVLYYQFDRERFLGEEGSHLDLDADLPGPIARTAVDLLDLLAESAAAGFPQAEEYARRSAEFLDHRDRRNNERIFEAARASKRRRNLRARFVNHPVVAAAWRFLRRHPLYFPAMRLMYSALLHLPADPRLVVFESGLGRQYADSPRYVYEELIRRDAGFKAIWAYERRLPHSDPNTRVVPRLSPAYFFYLARARYWVNNQSFPHYVRRRPDGVFVQTWHGTPLKRMLWDLDQVHGRDAGYLQRATTGAAQWSLLVSPSPYTTSAIRSAFRYQGEVLETGYPRNDVLHAPDREARRNRIRARLGLRPEQRVILYAPTFRDDQKDGNGRFTFTLPFDLARFHQALGDDTVLLLRMHVLVRKALDIPLELREWVRDVSTYPEMQELFLASDVLVTDYSSVFFDFAALDRPMVFYAYDIDSYRDDLRGFYLDYESVIPGPMVTTEDALLDALSTITELDDAYAPRRAAFVERFAPKDDAASASRVVDHVFGSRSGDHRGGASTGGTAASRSSSARRSA